MPRVAKRFVLVSSKKMRLVVFVAILSARMRISVIVNSAVADSLTLSASCAVSNTISKRENRCSVPFVERVGVTMRSKFCRKTRNGSENRRKKLLRKIKKLI